MSVQSDCNPLLQGDLGNLAKTATIHTIHNAIGVNAIIIVDNI